MATTHSQTAPTSSGPFDRILASPRAQRRFVWFSAGVLLAGIVAVIGVFVFRDATPKQHFTKTPATLTHLPVPAPPSPAAFKVAREFLETAVVRKNLKLAYTLVAPSLKAGESKREWLSGTNPIQPYPAKNAKTTGFTVVHSYKNALQLEFVLIPKPNTQVKPLQFFMQLVPVGGKHRRWVVDYFQTTWHPSVPNGIGGVGG